MSLSVNRDPVFIFHIISNLSKEINVNNKLVHSIDSLKRLSDDTLTHDDFLNGCELINNQKNANAKNFDKLINDLKLISSSFALDLFKKTHQYEFFKIKDNYTIDKEKNINQINDSLRRIYDAFILNDLKIRKENIEKNSIEDYLKEQMYKIDTFRITLIDTISKIAAEYAFNQLSTGSLNLEQLGAQEGDVVKIYVVRYLSRDILNRDGSIDTIKTETSLPILSVKVKNLGWTLKPTDSFFLINRINPDLNAPNVSPSKFKGAPGCTFLLSYGNDKRKFIKYRAEPDIIVGRGDTIHSNRSLPDYTKKRRILRFLKALEPSFGINVSYVDFDTKKDFEVGVGVVMGLFRNAILFTGGFDLNVTTHPFYMGIGFSFGQVYQDIKTGFKNPN